MLEDVQSGMELERNIKSILERNNFSFKEQPLLTRFNLKFDFLVVNKNNELFALEVSKRNSSEDIQRLCFRSIVCKEHHENIRTVAVVPSFSGSRSMLKLIGLLIRYFDLFVFEEDLETLPDLLNSGSNKIFLRMVEGRLAALQLDFVKILELFQTRNLLEMGEISELSGLDRSRVTSLLKGMTFSLQTIGLVECNGNTCMLADKFLERSTSRPLTSLRRTSSTAI